jgi:hypothetical protein
MATAAALGETDATTATTATMATLPRFGVFDWGAWEPGMRAVEKIGIKGFKSIESLELGDLNIPIGAFKLLERYASDRLKERVGTKPDHSLRHGSKVTPEMTIQLVSNDAMGPMVAAYGHAGPPFV